MFCLSVLTSIPPIARASFSTYKICTFRRGQELNVAEPQLASTKGIIEVKFCRDHHVRSPKHKHGQRRRWYESQEKHCGEPASACPEWGLQGRRPQWHHEDRGGRWAEVKLMRVWWSIISEMDWGGIIMGDLSRHHGLRHWGYENTAYYYQVGGREYLL